MCLIVTNTPDVSENFSTFFPFVFVKIVRLVYSPALSLCICFVRLLINFKFGHFLFFFAIVDVSFSLLYIPSHPPHFLSFGFVDWNVSTIGKLNHFAHMYFIIFQRILVKQIDRCSQTNEASPRVYRTEKLLTVFHWYWRESMMCFMCYCCCFHLIFFLFDNVYVAFAVTYLYLCKKPPFFVLCCRMNVRRCACGLVRDKWTTEKSKKIVGCCGRSTVKLLLVGHGRALRQMRVYTNTFTRARHECLYVLFLFFVFGKKFPFFSLLSFSVLFVIWCSTERIKINTHKQSREKIGKNASTHGWNKVKNTEKKKSNFCLLID